MSIMPSRDASGTWTEAESPEVAATLSIARACPFCHTSQQDLASEEEGFYLWCTVCGAMGPAGTDLQDAISQWNGDINATKQS
jgi:hypothetical protein